MFKFRESAKYIFVISGIICFSALLNACNNSLTVYRGAILSETVSGAANLRIIALGDSGSFDDTKSSNQQLIADDLAIFAASNPVDFLLYLGDNFYPSGVQSVSDPLWTSTFKDIYDFSELTTFYSIAGNHDHYGNVLAEVDYSYLDSSWIMPSLSYSFAWKLSDGTRIDFMAIDTTILADPETAGVSKDEAEAHWRWIKDRIKTVSGGNIIVFGHHPVYSSGYHGDNPVLIDRLQSLLSENGVDIYFSGHDHDLEIRKPLNDVTYVISGAGGELKDLTETNDPQTLYAASIPGAIIIEVDSNGYTLTVRDSLNQSEPFSVTYPWN